MKAQRHKEKDKKGRAEASWLGVFVAILGLYYGVQQVRLNLASRSAMGYWSRVMQINPNSTRAAMELGEVYLQRGEKGQAFRFLFSPTRKQLHAPCLVMSRYYRTQGDHLAAAVHLRVARHDETGLQFQTYQRTKAELLYAAGAPEYAEEAFGTVLTANPYNVEAMERLAEIWVFKGYVTAAYRLLEQATEIAPSHPVVARMRTKLEAQRSMLIASETPPIMQPPEPGWLQYVTRGGYHPPPIETVLQLSETHPDDPVIQLEAGICLVRKDRPGQALSKLRFVVQSLPSCAYAWAIKCLAASQAGAYEEAMAAGLRANDLDPKSATVHSTLGILFSKRADARSDGPDRRRDLDQAIWHLQFALSLNERNAVTHKVLAELLTMQGRFEEAVGHLRQALQLQPSFASAHHELGKVLAAQEKFEEAISYFRQALRLQPDQAEVHDNLGIALVQQGKSEEAVEQFRQAVRLSPTYERAHANLSKVLIGQSRFREAIIALQQALTSLPGDLNLSITLSWLLATCPDPDLRNGALAVQLAERVCRKTGYKYPKPLDVLAAAYAEMGRYDAAVQQARHALQLAISSGQGELGEQIAGRLKLYKTHLTGRERP